MSRILSMCAVCPAIVLIAVTPAMPAMADDSNPPGWRGGPHTTFQHWGFLPASPQGAPDSGLNNPYGNPKVTAVAANYFPLLTERIGVWGLGAGDSLLFEVPNDNSPGAFKELWIQVTWSAVVPPNIIAVTNTMAAFRLTGSETDELDDGWFHTTYHFNADDCPVTEFVRIRNGDPNHGLLLIDQVVIDTICVTAPAPGACGLGVFMLLIGTRRRR